MHLLKASLNPSWPHFLGIFVILLAWVLGLGRLLLGGWSDPTHCQALLNDGSWLDFNRENWQPNGCMLHSYTEKEAASCLGAKEIIFIGDSVTRKLFFQTANALDTTLPTLPLDEKKHADYSFRTIYGNNLTFAWDPFLNSSYTMQLIRKTRSNEIIPGDPSSPAMLVLGSGLWYLRYANASGGISAWASNMDHIFASLSSPTKAADKVVILPVEEITPSKLSPDRALTMHPSDIDAMNSDLHHRINPLLHDFRSIFSESMYNNEVSLPLVFNKMLDESLTEDGLHYSDALVRVQARILINLRCNDVMPKTFPLNKTCCSRYPLPSFFQTVILALVFFLGPYIAYKAFPSGLGDPYTALFGKRTLPYITISLSVALIFFSDRTAFWEKEQKQFNAWTFGALCAFSLVSGLLTLKRIDIDPGFLNREQTDEWKGWMQIAILIYHYLRASTVSGIYNPIRVLVASYLFMTGYGHTTFYLRKADFDFQRVAQVLVRLNLFTVILAYAMNTDYISYYFTPLVSMWYIVVYATMSIGARFNGRTPLLLFKIFSSAALMTWFMDDSWLLVALFDTLHRFFAIHWSASEWAFRVNLDIWIVYVGMLTAILVVKIRENSLEDHPSWPILVNGSVITSIFVMLWFFLFELYQESKFTYNSWHPYISFLPVLSFTVLRNSNTVLRSSSSKAFAFVGKCSLETFIIQFHLWLAGDSKGVLLVVHGTQWRPLNFVITTTMFLYLSDRVAWAIAEVTPSICGIRNRELPPPTTARTGNDDASKGQEITIPSLPFHNKDEGGNALQMEREPDTPIRPARWVDRLAQTTSSSQPPYAKGLQRWLAKRSQSWRLSARIILFFIVVRLLNTFWPYPRRLDSSPGV